MDLALVPGLPPEDARRLQQAGIPDVAALALATDLPALAARAGIPAARLAAFQASALDLHEEAGISIVTPAPFQEVAQTLWRAAEDLQAEAAQRLVRARDGVTGAWTRALAHAAGTAAAGLREVRLATLQARRRARPAA